MNSIAKSRLQTALTIVGRQEKSTTPIASLRALMKQQYDFMNLLFQEVNLMKELEKSIRSDHMKGAVDKLYNLADKLYEIRSPITSSFYKVYRIS